MLHLFITIIRNYNY